MFAVVLLAITSHMVNMDRGRETVFHSQHLLPERIVSGGDHHCPEEETKAQSSRVTLSCPGNRQSKDFSASWNLSLRSSG